MSLSIPKGFGFAGVHCGIKADRSQRDLTLLVSELQASAAGVFTINRVRAAPVRISQKRLPAANIRGVVVNSGNANACTGKRGLDDSGRMTDELAKRIGCDSEQVLVCSTGIIGRALPMEKIIPAISDAAGRLGTEQDSVTAAAEGILTTDTGIKTSSRQIECAGSSACILGLAKGAAMIGPNMATMLAFLLTDAAAETSFLDRALRAAVETSFCCISVEGHTSTNDSVLILANGASCQSLCDEATFAKAIQEVCEELAQLIVRDAEGATHFVTIDVQGTRDDAEAKKVAQTVANSVLVKTAIHGNDPNWGRITSAAGYAGIDFDEEDLSVRVNGTLLYEKGAPTDSGEADESARMRDTRDTYIELTFTLGVGKCRFWTSDLSQEYVRLNSDYTT